MMLPQAMRQGAKRQTRQMQLILEMTTTPVVMKLVLLDLAFDMPSLAELITTDQAIGHVHAQLGTPKTQVASDTD